MLKKITTAQLRVGMYVHQLVGSWLEHPFWKKSFLLNERKQLDLITKSGIRQIWIDTSRGLDVEAAASTDEEEVDAHFDDAALMTLIATKFAAEFDMDLAQPCSLADELERAGRIVAQARSAMRVMFQEARLGKAINAEECLPLVEDITESVNRNPGAIVSLARLKTSDDYTYMHSVAVCALMVSLARQLDLPAEMVREAGLAGLVHDLGKVRMPPEVLNKQGALTAEEFAIMRTHPQAGYDMLAEARGVSAGAMDVCLLHHEKMNGKGYPHGLVGDRIPMLARMGAVTDVYDAITSNRPYKNSWDPASSIQRMAQWSREGHFDDRLLQAFIKSIGIYPVGSLVKLSSGRLAVVVDQTPGKLLTPLVKTIMTVATRAPCEWEIIDLAASGASEKVVSRELAADWGLTAIDDHWRFPSAATSAVR